MSPILDTALADANKGIASFQAEYDMAPNSRIKNNAATQTKFAEIFTALRTAEWEAEKIAAGHSGLRSGPPAQATLNGIRNCRKTVRIFQEMVKAEPAPQLSFEASYVVPVCIAARRMQGEA